MNLTTPTKVADLIAKTANTQTDINERPDIVVLHASLANSSLRDEWLSFRRHVPSFLVGITITHADTDTELDDATVPQAEDIFRITLQKRTSPGALHLFFPESLLKAQTEYESASTVYVAQMRTDEAFTTQFGQVCAWCSGPGTSYNASRSVLDPRTYCTDLTSENVVPADIRQWLLKGSPGKEGAVFQAWKAMASRRLMAAISDQVSGSANNPTYQFNGPPRRSFRLEENDAVYLFDRLSEGAKWVYSEAHDTEARHLLLANEWARSYRSEAVREMGEGAVDSARSAYGAYVESGSRETLKALAELRKSVVDESQKIAQRANDLAGAMWKDLAVAVTPFVVKLLSDSTKTTGGGPVVGWVAMAAALFLVFSFSVQMFINWRYFKHQGDARELWQQSLNVVLSKSEISQFSEDPVRRAVRDYYRVSIGVGAVYAVLVVVLVGFSVKTFQANSLTALPENTQPVHISQENPSTSHSPSFGFLSWRDKKGNLPPDAPRPTGLCLKWSPATWQQPPGASAPTQAPPPAPSCSPPPSTTVP